MEKELSARKILRTHDCHSKASTDRTLSQLNQCYAREFREMLPKIVWIVGVTNCEENSIKAICATKEIAERELFKARDELITEWKELDEYCQKSIKEFCKKERKPTWRNDMYKNMITALSGNDYKKWDNYPHNCPYLYKTEIIGINDILKKLEEWG